MNGRHVSSTRFSSLPDIVHTSQVAHCAACFFERGRQKLPSCSPDEVREWLRNRLSFYDKNRNDNHAAVYYRERYSKMLLGEIIAAALDFRRRYNLGLGWSRLSKAPNIFHMSVTWDDFFPLTHIAERRSLRLIKMLAGVGGRSANSLSYSADSYSSASMRPATTVSPTVVCFQHQRRR
jgi:hypothetical protein